MVSSANSDLVVVEHKVDITWSLCVVPYEVFITLRSLLLRITRQHALQADADTLNVVHWRPTRAVEKIKTDDAVGVDVRMPGYGVLVVFDKDYFGCLSDMGVSM